MPGRPTEELELRPEAAIVRAEQKDELQVLFDEKKDALVDMVLAGANPTAAAAMFRTLLEFTRSKPAQVVKSEGGGPTFNVVVSSIGSKESE